MKRLELPKNKFKKLAINIVFIVAWFFVASYIFFFGDWLIYSVILKDKLPIYWLMSSWVIKGGVFLRYLLLFLPMILVTRVFWFGRIKLSPRITRSKD